MRAFISILSLSLILGFTACGGGDNASSDGGQGADDIQTADDGQATGDVGTSADTEATEDVLGDDAGPEDEDSSAFPDVDEPEPGDPIELIGSWDTDFGMTSEITTTTWDGANIVDYDNDADWAVVQMPEDAEWNPGTFSKYVWTNPSDGRWYLCIVDYGLDTAEAAAGSSEMADSSNPTVSGCGAFPWTEMRTPLEVKGEWHTNYDENLTVTTYTWGTYETLVHHDNDANWAISRTPDDAGWNPGTYSKLVWTDVDADGGFWMCTVAYGLESPEAAKADATEADDTDPANSGCGAFGWTRYIPVVEITGWWHSSYGGEHKVNSTLWGLDVVHAYDNTDNWAVVQLPESDEWNPSAYMKNVWTEPDADGSFHYCTVAYGLGTLDEALAAEDLSDDTALDTDGCDGFPWTHFGPLIEVKGSYTDQFDTTETIDSDTWESFDIVSYDNAVNHAVLYTPMDAEWSADTYSKVVWLEADWDGSFYYCTVAYELETAEEAAVAEDISDDTALDTGGCGGFPWTKLTPSL